MLFQKRVASAIHHKSCPICLTHIETRKAAVLSVCMHVYCIDCIRRWSRLKRTCPLCNAHFRSWFLKSRSPNSKFQEESLPNLVTTDTKNEIIEEHNNNSRGSRRRFSSQRRPVCGQLPWRRSFGWSRYMSDDERQRYQERVLQWRASIYLRHLQAVPLPSKNTQEQDNLRNGFLKDRIWQRIEPWIKRELQAILQDSDPSVIVHLATSLYISSLESKLNGSSDCHSGEEMFVQQLRPFLQDQTNMFWHELRCFAGSSFEMATYDSVIEYKHQE